MTHSECNRLIIRDCGRGYVQISIHWSGQPVPEVIGHPFPFSIPLSKDEQEELRWYLEDYLEDQAIYGDRGDHVRSKISSWGEKLFSDLIFHGNRADAFTRLINSRLPYEVIIQSSDTRFFNVPWEMIKPKHAKPLVFESEAFIRFVPDDAPSREFESSEEIRALLIIARPAGLEDVGYRTMGRPLLEEIELAESSLVIDVLRPPTLERLKERLREGARGKTPYQIVHFDGHAELFMGEASASPGSVGKSTASCSDVRFLFEESVTGGKDLVAAGTLAGILREAKVPLVILNACRSGTPAIAAALSNAGVTAVVAMQYSIYVSAAASFMREFYKSLLRGDAVPKAVNAGRAHLRDRDKRPSLKGPQSLEDWIVPVCYVRRIFKIVERTGLIESMDIIFNKYAIVPGFNSPERQLPIPSTTRFVGRDGDFFKLELALPNRRVIVITGPGGMGKTELVKAFARWWQVTGALEKSNYVFFQSFEIGSAPASLDQIVDEIGQAMLGQKFEKIRTDKRVDLVLEILRQHRALLIWDNFETAKTMPDPAIERPLYSQEQLGRFRDFVQEFRRRGQSCLLITTRHEEKWLGDLMHHKLSGLRRGEVIELADHILSAYPCGRAQRLDPAFADLLYFLDGHPRSLQNVLPLLERFTPGKLLAGLRGEEKLPGSMVSEQDRDQSLMASVHYSMVHLGTDARRLLLALPLCGRTIELKVLVKFSASTIAPNRFANASEEIWRDVLEEAAAFGLLSPRDHDSYRLPPDVDAYLRWQWREQAAQGYEGEEQAARIALAAAYMGSPEWGYDHSDQATANLTFGVEPRDGSSMFSPKVGLSYPRGTDIDSKEIYDAREICYYCATGGGAP